MIEYWLQKKTISGWSNVTWYDNQEQALKNFAGMSAGNSGYSWRVMKAEVVEQRLLDEVVTVPAPELEDKAAAFKANHGWGVPGAINPAPVVQGWGKPSNSTSISPSPDDFNKSEAQHGLSGSVWLVHHGLKKKTRVPASEADALIAQGYERGSPRTEFK